MRLKARPGALLAMPAGALLLLNLLAPADAHAFIEGAVPITGPDPAVVELGGVAMAEDGTGGLVYRRFEEGATHVFAARYDGTRWHPPQRVDGGQRFESTWPRIGAANDGRLVVTWVQDGGEGFDSMWSATLPRRSARFLAPTLVDYTVGEARATHPSIAMAPGGEALLAYRVVTSFTATDLPPGYVRGETRLARFDGWRWQRFGMPVDRNRTAPKRQPTGDNGPRVTILPDGRGAVAWQEPDERLVDRVWTRRVFSNRTGIPLQASPATGGHANALAIDSTPLGRVVVATRQLPDPRDRTAAPRIYVNELPESTDEGAARFLASGPQLADGSGGAAPGTPSVALGGRTGLLVGFDRSGTSIVAAGEGDRTTDVQPVAALPDGAPPSAIDAGAAGRGTVAVASGEGGGRVIVRQLAGARTIATQAVAGPRGGPIRSIFAAGSGTGDALVAFAQGEDDEGQIAVARVHAPPVPFALQPPPDWTRARAPVITWDPPQVGFRPRSYTVELDGRPVARTRADSFRFREGTLADGRHELRVVATNDAGETTATDVRPLLLDRAAPVATVQRRGRAIEVRIEDPAPVPAPPRGAPRPSPVETSGPAPESTAIDWGDGRSDDAVTDRATHSYRRAGRYRVVVRAVDLANNLATIRLTVDAPAARGRARARARAKPRPRSRARGRARSRAAPRGRRPTTKEQR